MRVKEKKKGAWVVQKSLNIPLNLKTSQLFLWMDGESPYILWSWAHHSAHRKVHWENKALADHRITMITRFHSATILIQDHLYLTISMCSRHESQIRSQLYATGCKVIPIVHLTFDLNGCSLLPATLSTIHLTAGSFTNWMLLNFAGANLPLDVVN